MIRSGARADQDGLSDALFYIVAVFAHVNRNLESPISIHRVTKNGRAATDTLLFSSSGLIAFPGNASDPADTNAATHGVVVTRLALTFANNHGANRNRAVDMTAAQLADISHLKIGLFQTGIYQSRGNATAAGCW